RQVSDEDMVEAMGQCIERMEKAGIGRFLDFREGGTKGARQLLEALDGGNVAGDIYSRPGTNIYDSGEMEELLSISTGIGISAISDWNLEELRKVSDHVHRKKGSLALHASEREREDIDQVLDMKPKFLVHMIKAAGDDLAICAENDVPIVICPRANSFFGLEPPIQKMMDAGVSICLGTDNVMLAEPDMFSEMRFLRGMVPTDVVSSGALLTMVFENCRKVLNQVPNIGVEPWGHDGFIVLNRPLDNPASQVIDATPDDILFIWKSGGN
ncbi:MAG: amidohydrolase family protein, partial [Thermoplasmata archaeon]|nr:amidohydrolase family protein [Thermoplasmata archaeon]